MSDEFAAAERERAGVPLTFELGGRTWTCRRKLPFALLGRLASRLSAEGPDALQAFADVLIYAVIRQEREDFRALLLELPEDDDDETTVGFEDVSRAAAQVIERITGSPFGSASVSPPSRSPNGAMSPVRVVSEASTSQPARRAKL